MLYLLCPTCKERLGSVQIQYETVLEKICRDEELGKINEEEAKKLKSELIMAFNLNRYCCTMRLMTFKQLINIVK